jgi:hypothetical protein
MRQVRCANCRIGPLPEADGRDFAMRVNQFAGRRAARSSLPSPLQGRRATHPGRVSARALIFGPAAVRGGPSYPLLQLCTLTDSSGRPTLDRHHICSATRGRAYSRKLCGWLARA